jgi:hypothetical protein
MSISPYRVPLEEIRLVGIRIIAPPEILALIINEAKQQQLGDMNIDPMDTPAILSKDEWRSLIGGFHFLRQHTAERHGREPGHVVVTAGGLVAVDVGDSKHVGMLSRFAEHAASK